MEYIEINNLVPHPKNDYYFDDITGEKWDELLMSIQTNGIHTPILVTSPDKDSSIPKYKKIIISGHQRVRACIELGIKKIPYTYKRYKSEDEILLALIESNIIQRGVGNSNPLKLGRCLNELDRIYGIKRGNNQHSNPNYLDSAMPKRSKKDIATALELSQETLTNYQKLTQLDAELQEMLLNNTLTPTNGIKIAKKVPKEKQQELVKQLKGSDCSSKTISSFLSSSSKTEISNKEANQDEAFVLRFSESPYAIFPYLDKITDSYKKTLYEIIKKYHAYLGDGNMKEIEQNAKFLSSYSEHLTLIANRIKLIVENQEMIVELIKERKNK